MVLRGLVAVSICVAVVAASGPVWADAAEVEALIAKGNELRRAGTPGPALPYFQKAYQLARTPRTSGQLGLAELAAGYPVEAAEHLAAALETPNDPSIAKFQQMLADALTRARSQIGELAIQGGPAGAEVVINGRTVGTLPLASPVKLPARSAEVLVRAPGHTERRELVPIAPGQRHALTVNLEMIEKPPEQPAVITILTPPPAPTSAPAARAPAATAVERRPADGGSTDSGLRTAAWAFGGGALAAAGAGLALNLASNSNGAAFDASCKRVGGEIVSDGPLSEGQCRDHYDDWESYRLWSIVGYATGAALAVTSAVLFVMSRPTPAAATASARLTCAPTLTGVSCQGLF
jgi:hypothetical protein